MDSIILFSSTPKMFARFAAKSAWGPKTRGFLAIKGLTVTDWASRDKG